jgi:hypothetical protein
MPKLPPLTIPDEGHTYCDDLLGHRICTGSVNGVRQYFPLCRSAPIKMRLAKVRMVDHDYAPNGAYFGAVEGRPLYHAESVLEYVVEGQEEPRTVRMFVRGATRQEARERVLAQLPGASFFR